MKWFQIPAVALAAFFAFGCGGNATVVPAAASPGDTLKKFVEASKKKDIAAVRQTLSKSSLEIVEKSAQAQNTTVDELLARGDSEMFAADPEISSERVENETASVDVKVKTGEIDTIPFVKEAGVWKIAFDKYQQMLMEKMRREMKPPPANVAAPNGSQKSNAPAGQPTANK